MYDKMFELELERRIRDLIGRPAGGNYVESEGGKYRLFVDGKLVAAVNSMEALDAAKRILVDEAASEDDG